MGTRLELHDILVALLGSSNVYFQPPASIKMLYPCIRYERSSATTRFADDIPYYREKQYKLTLIDKNPDSILLEKIFELPKCVFDRHYTVDGLNHDVFTISF